MNPPSQRTRHAQLIPIEAGMVIGVILIVLAVVTPQADQILTKARLVEVFGLVAATRIDIMERMALSGEGISDQVLALNLREDADRENIEDYIGQKQSAISIDRRAAAAPSSEKKILDGLDQQSLDRLGKFEVRPVNNSIVVSGALGARQRPFFLTFNPVMFAQGGAGNVLWLCGKRKPPAGWSTPLERAGTDLPPALTFFVCR